jgi:hypothetical protein
MPSTIIIIKCLLRVTQRERDKVCKCMCVTGKWRTKMFSMADGSLSNLFTTYKGKATGEQRSREKEETKPEDGKHAYTQ